MQPRTSGENSLDLSIIVPLYNEEESLVPLYDSIVKSVGDGVRDCLRG